MTPEHRENFRLRFYFWRAIFLRIAFGGGDLSCGLSGSLFFIFSFIFFYFRAVAGSSCCFSFGWYFLLCNCWKEEGTGAFLILCVCVSVYCICHREQLYVDSVIVVLLYLQPRRLVSASTGAPETSKRSKTSGTPRQKRKWHDRESGEKL